MKHSEDEQDRQALERYRESDGRLNLDRLVEGWRWDWLELRREFRETYLELYGPSKSLASQPVPSSPKRPSHTQALSEDTPPQAT